MPRKTFLNIKMEASCLALKSKKINLRAFGSVQIQI